MTVTTHDDLEAVRLVVKALEGFESNDQERIIRWAREKLGLTNPSTPATTLLTPPNFPVTSQTSLTSEEKLTTDIKSFVDTKNPQSGVQLAATVAYYYRFEAPENERKQTITSNELQEACRKANRTRLSDPGQTLRDAHKLGLLDKGNEAGQFIINSVGENLVAMTLPQQDKGKAVSRAKKRKASPKKTKSAKK